MIFRLVAIATYLILTYGVIGGPVTPRKPDSVNLEVEKQEILPKTDNENILLTDGIYLFGQSHQPNQIQNEYFVFKVQNGKGLKKVSEKY